MSKVSTTAPAPAKSDESKNRPPIWSPFSKQPKTDEMDDSVRVSIGPQS